MTSENTKQTISYFDTFLMLSASFLYFLRVPTGLSLLWPRAMVAALLVIRYLPVMSKSYKLPAWIFTIVGISLLIWNQAPPEEWAKALNSMLQSVAIVSIMQTLSIPMGAGDFNYAVSSFLRKHAGNQGVLYCMIETFSHFLCSILNLGEVIIVLNAINESISSQIDDFKKYIGGAISRGHCTAFLWAPGSVTVLLTLQVFGMEWSDYFIPSFSIAAIGLVLAGASQYFRLRDKKFISTDESAASATNRKVFILCMIIIVIIIGISTLGKIFPNSTGSEIMVFDVTIVSSIWLISQIRKPGMKCELKKFSTKTLPAMGSLNAFFVTMGLFSEGLQYAGFDKILEDSTEVFRQMPCIIILLILPLIIIAFSMIGIHPMVSLAVLGPVMVQLVGNASAMQLALSTAMGCCLAYMISPFAGLILLLSQLLDLPPKKLALEYNFLHSLIYYIIGTAVIYFCF
ncbi:MAG: hypothetical protein ACI4LN_03140 [Anaerovoracaceae bacterium]